MKDFYEVPTQVVFSDSEDDGVKALIGGIAFEDGIICGECGSTIALDEIEEGNLKELPWVNVDLFHGWRSIQETPGRCRFRTRVHYMSRLLPSRRR